MDFFNISNEKKDQVMAEVGTAWKKISAILQEPGQPDEDPPVIVDPPEEEEPIDDTPKEGLARIVNFNFTPSVDQIWRNPDGPKGAWPFPNILNQVKRGRYFWDARKDLNAGQRFDDVEMTEGKLVSQWVPYIPGDGWEDQNYKDNATRVQNMLNAGIKDVMVTIMLLFYSDKVDSNGKPVPHEWNEGYVFEARSPVPPARSKIC